VFNGLNPAISRLVNARGGRRSATTEWQPAVDIREAAEQFVLQVDVPGVDLETIQVSTDDGVLKIQGSRAEAEEPTEVSYSQRERARGDFQRSFQLPESADVSNISASHKQGVLEIVVPKRPEVAPRKIEVTH
jgi:HSP20 family protein